MGAGPDEVEVEVLVRVEVELLPVEVAVADEDERVEVEDDPVGVAEPDELDLVVVGAAEGVVTGPLEEVATGAEVAVGVTVTVMYLRQVPAARRACLIPRPWWTGMAATLRARAARTQSKNFAVNIVDAGASEKSKKDRW